MQIVLATDGEAPAAEAERLLCDLAARPSAQLLVLCVNTFEMSLHRSEVLGLGHYSPDAGLRHAEMVAERAAARLEQAGFNTRWVAVEGDAAIGLLEVVEQHRCDLAVVGAGGRSWRGAPMLGRVSTNLLHGSTCSVLVVHEWPAPGEQAGVLVGTDGSPGALAAVEAFASFADPDRCRVLVVTVARPTIALPWSEEHARPGDHGVDPEQSLASAAAVLERHGFDHRTEVAEGHPAETLLRLAERDGCGLVVVGSRGLGTLKRMALGSVSDRVARSAGAAFVGRGADG